MSLLTPRPIDGSFLPEDYLERRAERRTNLFSIGLFVVVTLGVIGAFFVTSRQWNDVKSYQQAVNVRYTQAAKDIEQLKTLEVQKSDLLEKAEVTTALIERVPKSILLAELVNRMPMKMTLLSIEVNSTRLDKPVRRYDKPADPKKTGSGNAGAALSGKAGDPKKGEKPVITAPRFDHRVALIGVASTHNEVARYVSNLQECDLLKNVDLIFSEAARIEQTPMNRFRIEADLRSEADARRIEPKQAPRLQSPKDLAAPGQAPTPGAEPAQAPQLEEWKWNPEAPRPEPSHPNNTSPEGR